MKLVFALLASSALAQQTSTIPVDPTGTTIIVGSIEATNQSGFRVRRANSIQFIPAANVPTPIYFDTEDFDRGGLVNLSVSSGLFSVPSAGVYFAAFQVEYSSSGSGAYRTGAFFSNNLERVSRTIGAVSSVAQSRLGGSDVLFLNSGDTVALKATHGLATGTTVQFGQATSLTLMRLF